MLFESTLKSIGDSIDNFNITLEVDNIATIKDLVRKGLGVSILYRRVLEGFGADLVIRPVKEQMERPVALVFRNWDTMPYAARKFASYVQMKVEVGDQRVF